MLFLPEAKLAAGNTGVNVAETIVTDGAPDSVVHDLQTTFTPCCTADKSQAYNKHSATINQQQNIMMRSLIVCTNGRCLAACRFASRNSIQNVSLTYGIACLVMLLISPPYLLFSIV